MIVQVDLLGAEAVLISVQSKIDRVADAEHAVMEDITDVVYQRVLEKLDGEVIQRKSSKLYDSIKKEVVSDGNLIIGRVYSDGSVPYAVIQAEGGTTSPHEIVVNDARALRYNIGGLIRFSAKVQHPGSRIPGTEYMRDSLADCLSTIREIASQARI